MPSVVLSGYFALIVGIIAAIVIGITVFILGLVFGKKLFKKKITQSLRTRLNLRQMERLR